jgi:hypothetical protein
MRSRPSTVLNPNSQTQSTLAGASQCTSRGNFRVRDGGRVVDVTSNDKDKLLSDHCNRSPHTGETCTRLQGRPTQGRGGHTGGGSKPRVNHTSTLEMVVPTPNTHPSATNMRGLSKDEVEALC